MRKDIRLSELRYLALDCQATGADPAKNLLLELAWLRCNSRSETGPISPSSYLIRETDEVTIPPRVARVTGLTDQDFDQGCSSETVWSRLLEVAREVQRANDLEACPLVIHFARFERPYLRHLHATFSNQQDFPFTIICTYEISKRLFEDLPRKGLRAIAGYLGYSVEAKRRSTHHVTATAFIWRQLVSLLDSEEGIKGLVELRDWLSVEKPSNRNNRCYPMLSEQRDHLPAAPGVYRMLRSNKDILYIGKATSLRQRVNSYFQKRNGHAEHILEMLSQAQRIDHQVTETALEAALQELEEIKALSPPYNISMNREERATFFFAADLSNSSPGASEQFHVGPILQPHLLDAVHQLWKVLIADEQGIASESGAHTLSMREDYCPDQKCYLVGIHLFREKYSIHLGDEITARLLLTIGKYAWRIRCQEKEALSSRENQNEQEPESQSEAERKAEKTEFVWTPEAVVKRLESVLGQAAHQIRRARFLSLLSESCLLWQLRNAGAGKRMLVIDRAQIRLAAGIGEGQAPQIPPGYRKDRIGRLDSFDIDSYDRMRILSTEMRRLVKEGRPMELRLGPNRVLTTENLRRAFAWL